ncbi:MAG: hypothetical protein H6638_01115 [Ardenticatenales bacterium]|nr:hypothetical protein [Ardenticatenales bacterium]
MLTAYSLDFWTFDKSRASHPNETLTWWQSSRRGKRQRVEIQGWHTLLMRGKHTPQRLPMQHYPFTLVRLMHYDEAGNPLYQRPLWRVVMGERRGELTRQQILCRALRHRALFSLWQAEAAQGRLSDAGGGTGRERVAADAYRLRSTLGGAACRRSVDAALGT